MGDETAGQNGLAERLRGGDELALAELFGVHRERLWRVVSFRLDRRLSGRIAPEDVLQESYLAAAGRIGRFAADGFASPFVWLRLIVQQTLTDIHRRHLGAQKRDAGRELAIDARAPWMTTTSVSMAIQLVGDWTSPSGAAARAEAMDMVEKAMETMDPIDREVLAMRHFEELSNNEVAEALGIAPKASSVRYIRAVRRLREVLARVPGLLEEGGDV